MGKVNELEPVSRDPDAFSFQRYSACVSHLLFLCPSGNWRPSGRVECRANSHGRSRAQQKRLHTSNSVDANGIENTPFRSSRPFRASVRNVHGASQISIDSNANSADSKCAVNNGIVNALPPDRAAHFARFIRDYEHIRAAEGRWSQKDDFYLSLPYKDISGRNSKQWKIRARSFDYLMRHVLNRNLQLDGRRILDLGAGNCWMSYRLALAGYRPFAVDLLTNDHDGLGAAEHFRKHLPVMFPRFQAELRTCHFRLSNSTRLYSMPLSITPKIMCHSARGTSMRQKRRTW